MIQLRDPKRLPRDAVHSRFWRLQRRRVYRAPRTLFFASGRLALHGVRYTMYHVIWKYGIREFVGPFMPKLGQLHQHKPRALDFSAFPVVQTPTETPVVSIATPSYGQGEFIGRTIDSVLDQKYPALQYVVQDGGSKDDTVSVLESYGDRLSYESRPDKGQSHAINMGLGKTDGEIMAYLNSDDLLLPGSINRVVQEFNENPDVDVVYGNRLMIDEHDQLVGRWVLPGHNSDVLSWADYIPQETMFWRRRIWDAAGGQIDESFDFAMDWDLLLRFRNAGATFCHLPVFLGAFRIHSSQKTNAEIDELGQSDMERLRLRELGEKKSPIETREACVPFIMAHYREDLRYVRKRIPEDMPLAPSST